MADQGVGEAPDWRERARLVLDAIAMTGDWGALAVDYRAKPVDLLVAFAATAYAEGLAEGRKAAAGMRKALAKFVWLDEHFELLANRTDCQSASQLRRALNTATELLAAGGKEGQHDVATVD